jgi:hypothetical protein
LTLNFYIFVDLFIDKSGNNDSTPYGAYLGTLITQGQITPKDVHRYAFELVSCTGLDEYVDNYSIWKQLIEASISLVKIISAGKDIHHAL